jgi:hypothetical protein
LSHPVLAETSPGAIDTMRGEDATAHPTVMLDAPDEIVNALRRGMRRMQGVIIGNRRRNKLVEVDWLWWAGFPHKFRLYVPDVQTRRRDVMSSMQDPPASCTQRSQEDAVSYQQIVILARHER